jgi:hypothetical protein
MGQIKLFYGYETVPDVPDELEKTKFKFSLKSVHVIDRINLTRTHKKRMLMNSEHSP